MITTVQIVTAGFIQKKNGEFLIVKRAVDDDFQANFWEIPGGKLDLGEDILEGLKREVNEESGLDITVVYPLYTYKYTHPDNAEKEYLEIQFYCRLVNEEQQVTLSNEHAAYEWITFDRIDQFSPMSDETRDILHSYANHPVVKSVYEDS